MEYKKYIGERYWQHLLSVPFIWAVGVPLLFLDIILELYHHICFPLYNLDLVRRDKYIKIDRPKLKYLGWGDKINCAYCGYANGLIAYAQEIAARTEKYWCGIKHQSSPEFKEPAHHQEFAVYGDQVDFERKYFGKGEEGEEADKRFIP